MPTRDVWLLRHCAALGVVRQEYCISKRPKRYIHPVISEKGICCLLSSGTLVAGAPSHHLNAQEAFPPFRHLCKAKKKSCLKYLIVSFVFAVWHQWVVETNIILRLKEFPLGLCYRTTQRSFHCCCLHYLYGR